MFGEGLKRIINRLEEARTHGLLREYALIGGLAVSAWAGPRATRDLDFAVAIGSGSEQSLTAFVGGSYQAGEPEDPLRGVVSTAIRVAQESIPVQLVFLPRQFSDVIFEGIKKLTLMGSSVPVVAWDKLVLLKLYAGGPQDTLDAKQILEAKHPNLETLAKLAALAEQVDLADEWAQLLRQVRLA